MPLNANAIYPSLDPDFIAFPSRRSVVHSTQGIIACTQPLAAQAGQRILRDGGNAADAAVAVAAALNMTEPSSTGIGGDMFCLFYNAKTKKVHALNGSGRSPANTSLEGLRRDLGLKPGQPGTISMSSVHSVTTPGAAAGWIDTVEKFGSKRLSLKQILTPAIELGEEGFPVSELASRFVSVRRRRQNTNDNTFQWQASEKHIRDACPHFGEMLKSDNKAPDGKRAPRPGELFENPTLANTFRVLAQNGKKGFYEGPVATSLIQVVQGLGGHLTMEDLKHHADLGSEEVDAISLKFNGQNISKAPTGAEDGQAGKSDETEGLEVWEHPPNGQGIVALMALGILEELERTQRIRTFIEGEHNCAEYLHAVIESLRIAFADTSWWVTDPNVERVPSKELISRSYLSERATLFDPNKASDIIDHGSPAHNHCDTVYFAVTDRFGNAISFINSVYGKFGTGIIPQGCGFTLQSRAANFNLQEGHPNAYAPRKRPYHTIIPAIVTNSNDQSLHTVYGVMGGFMQPQGHVQVLLNMLAFRHTPQAALDAPRFCIGAGTPEQGKVLDRTIYLEEGIGEEVVKQLRVLGHNVEIVKGYGRGIFGCGQVIRCHRENGKYVYSGGSDPRGDGAAVPA